MAESLVAELPEWAFVAKKTAKVGFSLLNWSFINHKNMIIFIFNIPVFVMMLQ